MPGTFSAFNALHRETNFPVLAIALATVQRIIERHGGRIGPREPWRREQPFIYFNDPRANRDDANLPRRRTEPGLVIRVTSEAQSFQTVQFVRGGLGDPELFEDAHQLGGCRPIFGRL